jgi:hypothetical protein
VLQKCEILLIALCRPCISTAATGTESDGQAAAADLKSAKAGLSTSSTYAAAKQSFEILIEHGSLICVSHSCLKQAVRRIWVFCACEQEFDSDMFSGKHRTKFDKNTRTQSQSSAHQRLCAKLKKTFSSGVFQAP